MKLNKQEKVYRQPIEVSTAIERRSFRLLRLAGYILLAFSLIDFISILIPLHLTDPVWELQTISQLVDRIWAPLLGLTLIFFHTENNWISPREISILQCLSWAALVLGLVYLLMLPLGINDSLTIYRSTNAQITNQLGQQISQIQILNQKLNTAATADELKTINRIINPRIDTPPNLTNEELKNNLSQQIQATLKNISTAASTAKRQQKIRLFKEAVRVNLGALLSGVCLIAVWHLTRWVRIANKNAI